MDGWRDRWTDGQMDGWTNIKQYAHDHSMMGNGCIRYRQALIMCDIVHFYSPQSPNAAISIFTWFIHEATLSSHSLS